MGHQRTCCPRKLTSVLPSEPTSPIGPGMSAWCQTRKFPIFATLLPSTCESRRGAAITSLQLRADTTAEPDPERTFAHPPTELCLRYGRPLACQRDKTASNQLDLLCKRAVPGRFGVVSTNEGVFMANPTPTNAADDADPERAAPDITNTTPENQAPTFRNQD
jgi:hypothetical protein